MAEIAYLISSHDECPERKVPNGPNSIERTAESSCFYEFAFSSRNRASGASPTCIYSPLSYLSCQVFGQRDAEEIPRGPRGASCTRALCLWALMLPIVQAAEKSIALLKSSPDVTISLASGVSRSFISVHATAGE